MLRAPDRPDYDHWEWELLELLRPHLQRALAVHGRMRTLEGARSAAEGVLDRLPVALTAGLLARGRERLARVGSDAIRRPR